MDYLVLSKNLYIKNCDGIFGSYNYSNQIMGEFKIRHHENYIEFYHDNNNIEAINLMSEILYFMGKKKKDVVFNGDDTLDLSAINFKKIDNKYIKKIIDFETERQYKFENINDLYNHPHLVPWNLVEREHDVVLLVKKYVLNDKKILEIGSGYGKNLDLLTNYYGYKNVTGIEYSENAYKISQKIVSNNLLGDITKTDFASDSFDVIVDIGCLHCVNTDNKQAALNEVLRILKKDGLIISRYFLTKSDDWVKNYPIKIDSFGNSYEKIIGMFSDFNLIETFTQNECVYIVGRKK